MVLTLTTLFFTSFLVALSGAMMPGPLLTYAVGQTAKRGFIAGPLIVAGHAILELVLVFSLAVGLLSFLGEKWLLDAISVAGGAVIVLMGAGMIRDRLSAAHEATAGLVQAGPSLLSLEHPLVGGILVSVANPYWSLWWVGVIAAYSKQVSAEGLPGYALFFSGHILADLAWYCLIAFVVSSGRRWLSERFYVYLILLSGIFLLLLGAAFILSGLV